MSSFGELSKPSKRKSFFYTLHNIYHFLDVIFINFITQYTTSCEHVHNNNIIIFGILMYSKDYEMFHALLSYNLNNIFHLRTNLLTCQLIVR